MILIIFIVSVRTLFINVSKRKLNFHFFVFVILYTLWVFHSLSLPLQTSALTFKRIFEPIHEDMHAYTYVIDCAVSVCVGLDKFLNEFVMPECFRSITNSWSSK